MHISPILLEVLIQLRIVFVCMKRTTVSYGSIRIGEQDWQKFEGLEGYQCHLYVLWPTMNMHFSGTFTRQANLCLDLSSILFGCVASVYVFYLNFPLLNILMPS